MDTHDPRTSEADDAAVLAEALHADLQRLAHNLRSRSGAASETLRTTALVNEAYLRLARQGRFREREHFLATAALAMRQVLVGHARQRLADKRGGGQAALSIDLVHEVLGASEARVVALDDALRDLEREHPRLARVVECRYFAGYTDAETAEALAVTERTVQRDWAKAKALLYDALGTG
jgi:RNA polymerase sigma factor (TIGR02999 family)